MSKYTAITRNKPSLPTRYLFERGLLVGRCLDYGCGRGFDAEFFGLDKYDPNWFPVWMLGQYDTIICNYVLNVVTDEDMEEIFENLYILLKDNGKVYFTVRRDIEEDIVGRGCIQRPVRLPLKTIRHKKGSYEMYEGNLNDLWKLIFGE